MLGVMKAVLLSLACLAATARGEAPWGARLELVSENSAIAAGEPFEVGIRIHHREGFHSYWRHPGKVGFATKVDWRLPDGFHAGPLAWPAPELVDMAGNTAHGYHRDVLLTATITPPATIGESKVTLAARIAWMACSDACHPGDKEFSLVLPVASKPSPDPQTVPLFEKTRADRPEPLAGWKVELLSATDAPTIVLRFTRTSGDAPRLEDPYFFSSDGQVDDGRPSVASREAGVEVWTFKRAEYGPKQAAGLPGLVAWGPEARRRFGTIAP